MSETADLNALARAAQRLGASGTEEEIEDVFRVLAAPQGEDANAKRAREFGNSPLWKDRAEAAEAERDRLKAALEECVHQIADDTKPAVIKARAALSSAGQQEDR